MPKRGLEFNSLGDFNDPANNPNVNETTEAAREYFDELLQDPVVSERLDHFESRLHEDDDTELACGFSAISGVIEVDEDERRRRVRGVIDDQEARERQRALLKRFESYDKNSGKEVVPGESYEELIAFGLNKSASELTRADRIKYNLALGGPDFDAIENE